MDVPLASENAGGLKPHSFLSLWKLLFLLHSLSTECPSCKARWHPSSPQPYLIPQFTLESLCGLFLWVLSLSCISKEMGALAGGFWKGPPVDLKFVSSWRDSLIADESVAKFCCFSLKCFLNLCYLLILRMILLLSVHVLMSCGKEFFAASIFIFWFGFLFGFLLLGGSLSPPPLSSSDMERMDFNQAVWLSSVTSSMSAERHSIGGQFFCWCIFSRWGLSVKPAFSWDPDGIDNSLPGGPVMPFCSGSRSWKSNAEPNFSAFTNTLWASYWVCWSALGSWNDFCFQKLNSV